MTEGAEALIGWQEWAYLPALNIGPIKAKIDTGARTSALHAFDIRVEGDEVAFKVHTIQRRDDFFIETRAALLDERLVRDSGGKETLRPVICTRLILAGREQDVELTLIDRQEMAFRMLVGRSAIAGTFLVDSDVRFLGGVPDTVKTWQIP